MYDVGCEIDSIGDSSSCDDDTEIGTTVVLINGQRHVLSGKVPVLIHYRWISYQIKEDMLTLFG